METHGNGQDACCPREIPSVIRQDKRLFENLTSDEKNPKRISDNTLLALGLIFLFAGGIGVIAEYSKT